MNTPKPFQTINRVHEE